MIRSRSAWGLGLLVAALLPTPAMADGETTRIKAIEIVGLERSQDALVLRELPFTTGSLWQPDMAVKAERRLRNLGLFRKVEVAPPDPHGRVLVSLRERWSFWILPTASRRDDGRSTVGMALDEFNLWGLGHHLRLAVEQDTGKNFSGSNGRTIETSYHWARIHDSRFSLGLAYAQGRSLFVGFEAGQSVANYLEDRLAYSATLSYALGPVPNEGWTLGIGLASSDESFMLLDGRPLVDVRDARRRTVEASIDYRRFDDHITWITGTLFSYRLARAMSALGSDLSYTQQTITLSRHLPLHDGNTLSMRIVGGAIGGDALRSTIFDLGNRNAIRGYFPGELQATSFVFGTVEGRFLAETGSNLQYVTFTDIGNLRNGDTHPFGRSLIAGLGAGLRWTLRWLVHGTVRLDMAYGLASRQWRLYLGTRQAF